jgi:hypothetical protein
LSKLRLFERGAVWLFDAFTTVAKTIMMAKQNEAIATTLK